MKRIIPSVCLAFACAVTLGAQSTGTGQSTDPYGSQKSSSDKSDKSVSLTGCLQEGDTPGTFVLANVDASSLSDMGREHGSMTQRPSDPSRPSDPTERPSDPASPPATGTSGAGASASSGMKVELTGGASANLKQHVGHQVEVTGTMAGGAKDSSSATGTSGSTGSTDTTAATREGSMGDKNVHKLTVKSVKMISSNCSM
jgi:hypothetical protein